MESLQLEVPWHTLTLGSKIDVQANQVIWDPLGKKHLFKSVIFGKFFTVEGQLERGFDYTFLRAEVTCTTRPHLTLGTGYALKLLVPTYGAYSRICEVCSGIGIMGEGLESTQAQIIASNELRPPFCHLQRLQGRKNVIQGDINDPDVVFRLHEACDEPAVVTVGFACQPWSRLGDKRQMEDARANTLQASLRFAYYIRAPIILMECVEEAGKDPEVQQVLKTFTRQTGFRASQINLALSNLMPIKRNRWWCVLSNPTLPSMPLEALPKLPEPVTFGQMFPFMPIWPQHDMDQLCLDRYETGKYYQFGNMEQLLAHRDSILPTALHGWSNQLASCPCGCREWPLSEGRLQSKGIHGVLLAIGGTYETEYSSMLRTRFLHPWEIAVLHGCCPNKLWGNNLRLAIAGLGQQASPIQSCWIYAQVKSHMQAFDGDMVVSPESMLWDHFGKLFHSVAATNQDFADHVIFRGFLSRVHDALFASATNRCGPGITFNNPAIEVPDQAGISQTSSDTGGEGPIVDNPSHEVPAHAAPPLRDETPDPWAAALHQASALPPTGGIVGFATDPVGAGNTRDEPRDSVAASVDHSAGPMTHPPVEERFSQEVAANIDEIDPPAQGNNEHYIMLFRHGDSRPVPVLMSPSATVGSLTVAEEKLKTMEQPIQVHTTVGTMMPLSDTTQPMQQVFLRETRDIKPADEMVQHLTSQSWACRSALLYHQHALVADDEMSHYLSIVGSSSYAEYQPPCVLRSVDYDDRLGELETWIGDCIPVGENATAFATAILMDSHWSPLLLVAATDGLNIYLPPGIRSIVEEACGSGNHIAQYHEIPMPSSFANDCGFQTVAWLLEQIHEPGKGRTGTPLLPMKVETAIMWRALFEHHLHVNSLNHECIEVGQFAFGGASDDVADQLGTLLSQHGVQSEALPDRIRTVLDKLGRTPVARALRTSRAWAEIKALANAAAPRVQLVLPSELSAVIAERVKSGANFGDKKSKITKVDNAPKAQLKLSAEDVSVPLGIFKEEGGAALQQISIREIGPNARGVIVVDSQQAIPYLRMNQPVSCGALALLIIDPQDTLISGVGKELRFPVRFNKTQEPMLITSKVVQLGQKEVVRMTPSQAVKVEEVSSNVFSGCGLCR
eukprot:Skav218565  [mRNA]  locus=scaffold2610:56753:60139:+ [translate_table: standard]